MSNETKVTVGVLAGAIATILWWIMREAGGVEAPAEVVAASVWIFTAAFQYFIPASKKDPHNG